MASEDFDFGRDDTPTCALLVCSAAGGKKSGFIRPKRPGRRKPV